MMILEKFHTSFIFNQNLASWKNNIFIFFGCLLVHTVKINFGVQQLLWGSEYQTSPAIEQSKTVQQPNGMLFNNYLNNGLIVPCLSHGLNCKQTVIEYLNNGISVRYSTHDLALSYKVRNLNGSVIRIPTVLRKTLPNIWQILDFSLIVKNFKRRPIS